MYDSTEYVIGEATKVYTVKNTSSSLWGTAIRYSQIGKIRQVLGYTWKKVGHRRAPKVGLSSRKWHVTAVEFGEMWQISECEISLLAVSVCSGLNTVIFLEPQNMTLREIGCL